jgi:hypothetical protein
MKKLLTVLLIVVSLTSLSQTTWKTVRDIPKKWIMVERDSIGYLIYDPCNGETPMISIDSGYVTVYWRLDAPRKLVINKYIKSKEQQSFFIDAADEFGNVVFTAIMKDNKQNLVLWSFDDHKWVMTPLENKKSFRHVDNPCPTVMKPEKKFLPVEF